jgi:type II secretory pathway component PulF
MMTLSEIETAASALGNQLNAGIPLHDAVRRMSIVQRKYEIEWTEIGEVIASGGLLSDRLSTLWPDNLLAAVIAGEQSGSLPAVFDRVEETMQLQQRIRGALLKLAYPAFVGLAGVGVFLFFMIKVLPTLVKSLGKPDKSLVFSLSTWLSGIYQNHLMLALVLIGGTLLGVGTWIKKTLDDGSLLSALTTLPVIGDALSHLYFGLWAYYLAILDQAGGMQVRDKLLLSSQVMPENLRRGIFLMADEVVARGLANAADPEKQMVDDPRREWPFYISTAFIVAQETGDLAREMLRVAPSLIKDGFKKVQFVTQALTTIAMTVSAFLVVSPLMAYYIQVGSQLRKAMQ